MKIAMIGAGSVGKALGGAFAAAGHEITYGLRDPEASKHEGLEGKKTSVRNAANSADIVVIAVPWPNVGEAVRDAGDLSGKIVIDCNNPIKPDFSGLDRDRTPSSAEYIQSLAPQARVVKAFNQTGAPNMADPAYSGGKPANFVAGDDPQALETVMTLSREIGFDPVRVPTLILARQLEEMAWLWISLAMKGEDGPNPNFAFSVVRR